MVAEGVPPDVNKSMPILPAVVIGEFDTVNAAGIVKPTLVTVPAPEEACKVTHVPPPM